MQDRSGAAKLQGDLRRAEGRQGTDCVTSATGGREGGRANYINIAGFRKPVDGNRDEKG